MQSCMCIVMDVWKHVQNTDTFTYHNLFKVFERHDHIAQSKFVGFVEFLQTHEHWSLPCRHYFCHSRIISGRTSTVRNWSCYEVSNFHLLTFDDSFTQKRSIPVDIYCRPYYVIHILAMRSKCRKCMFVYDITISEVKVQINWRVLNVHHPTYFGTPLDVLFCIISKVLSFSDTF